jgi:beta-galactosidase
MAAMEFRSYYAGKTVIRATSPGLKDATIQITSRGEPRFIAGKTPSVKPRPYVRFHRRGVQAFAAHAGLEQSDARQQRSARPRRAFANDGNRRDVLAGGCRATRTRGCAWIWNVS